MNAVPGPASTATIPRPWTWVKMSGPRIGFVHRAPVTVVPVTTARAPSTTLIPAGPSTSGAGRVTIRLPVTATSSPAR
ncbi:MAG: hypothetical protein ACRD2W_16040 [Acidimicrobiales bacterium]